jgi:hypothetical protein
VCVCVCMWGGGVGGGGRRPVSKLCRRELTVCSNVRAFFSSFICWTTSSISLSNFRLGSRSFEPASISVFSCSCRVFTLADNASNCACGAVLPVVSPPLYHSLLPRGAVDTFVFVPVLDIPECESHSTSQQNNLQGGGGGDERWGGLGKYVIHRTDQKAQRERQPPTHSPLTPRLDGSEHAWQRRTQTATSGAASVPSVVQLPTVSCPWV